MEWLSLHRICTTPEILSNIGMNLCCSLPRLLQPLRQALRPLLRHPLLMAHSQTWPPRAQVNLSQSPRRMDRFIPLGTLESTSLRTLLGTRMQIGRLLCATQMVNICWLPETPLNHGQLQCIVVFAH